MAPPRALPSLSRLAFPVAVYATALVSYALVYGTKERSVLTATATLLVTTILSLILLRRPGLELERLAIYSGALGLMVGEVTSALNYWAVGALLGGIFLLLVFYVTAGIVQAHLAGALTARVLAEYLTVGALGLVLLMTTGPWHG